MSRLKLFSPTGYDCESNTGGEEPVILSIKSFRRLLGDDTLGNVVDRARVLHRNSRCRHCEHPIVEPISLDDGIRNRNQLPIPGTSTLVGFHCHGCHREWPA